MQINEDFGDTHIHNFHRAQRLQSQWIHKKAKAHRSVTMISLGGGSKLDHVLIFLKATFSLLNDEMNECFYGYCHHYFLNVIVSQPKYGL